MSAFFGLVVFFFDMVTPASLQLSIFYIISVMVSAWYIGRLAGMVLAFFCAVLATLPHLLRAAPGEDILHILTWEVGAHFFLLGTVVLIFDLAMSKLTNVQRLAELDLLTGALNKVSFTNRLHQQLQLAKRANWPLTLVYVDIDLFKNVNDTLGHDQGDKALKIVSDALHETVRRTDTVGRLGGDEFALILLNADSEAAEAIMFSLRLSLQGYFAQWPTPVTCSTGAVTFVDPPLDARVALKAADALMYQAKREGRDRNCFELVHPTASPSCKENARRAYSRPRTNKARRAKP